MRDSSSSTRAASAPASRWARAARDWAPVLLMVFGILAARSTFADHYHVPSGSMEPALMPGDHVVVDKAAFGWRLPFTRHVVVEGDSPRRGDVVIFDSPEDGVRLIKRVVALAGDEVAVHRGRVFIDGVALAAPAAPGTEWFDRTPVRLNLEHGGGPELAPVQVPEGHVLVLGDHRGNSRDGRRFGFVPESALYGRARGVFWRSSEGPTWHAL